MGSALDASLEKLPTRDQYRLTARSSDPTAIDLNAILSEDAHLWSPRLRRRGYRDLSSRFLSFGEERMSTAIQRAHNCRDFVRFRARVVAVYGFRFVACERHTDRCSTRSFDDFDRVMA